MAAIFPPTREYFRYICSLRQKAIMYLGKFDCIWLPFFHKLVYLLSSKCHAFLDVRTFKKFTQKCDSYMHVVKNWSSIFEFYVELFCRIIFHNVFVRNERRYDM